MKKKILLIGTFVFLLSLISLYAGETEEHVLKVSGPVDLSIANVSGNITVDVWSRSEVRLLATKPSKSTDLRVRQSGSRIRIESHEPGVSYQISTPQSTSLEVRSVRGGISIRGINGKVDAVTVSGRLYLEGITARTLAKTVSGNLMLRRYQGGDLSVGTVSGDLQLDEVNGRVEAKSVSGNVQLSGAHSTRVDIITTSGDVVYEGDILKDGSYNVATHSGEIHVAVPVDSSFEVTAHSFSGSFESELPLRFLKGKIAREFSKTSLHAVYGRGGAVLELKTFSGDIRISKK